MTSKQLLVAAFLLGLMTTATFAQSQSGSGVSPVYIPGTNSSAKSTIKTVSTAEPITKSRTSNKVEPTKTTKRTSGSSPTSSCGGCGCDSGNCGNSDYWSDVCGCGDSACGGCCDRVGRSFFGRIRNLNPVKINVNRGGSDCGCDGGGDCGCNGGCDGCGCRTGLARLLPVTVKLRTNHCSRYFSIFGGYTDLEDYDGDNGGGAQRLIEFNDGWQMGVKLGKVFENNMRMESEFTYRHNTADTYSMGAFAGPDFVPTATFDSIDSVYSLSSMTNFLYDFKRAGRRTTPYIGFGAGGAFIEGDIITPALGRVDFISDYAFAYQLIAGASRKLNSNTTAFAEYKYFGTSGVDVQDGAGGAVLGEFDYQNNSVIFGLRFVRPMRRCCN